MSHRDTLVAIKQALNRSMANSIGKILARVFQQIILNTIIKAESLYQLMYLKFICYKSKLKDVITSLAVSHD